VRFDEEAFLVYVSLNGDSVVADVVRSLLRMRCHVGGIVPGFLILVISGTCGMGLRLGSLERLRVVLGAGTAAG
jgi:hypothetical protein